VESRKAKVAGISRFQRRRDVILRRQGVAENVLNDLDVVDGLGPRPQLAIDLQRDRRDSEFRDVSVAKVVADDVDARFDVIETRVCDRKR
jgi:hypothetical protein